MSVVALERLVFVRPTVISMIRLRRSFKIRCANLSPSVSWPDDAEEVRDISEPTDVADACEDDFRVASVGRRGRFVRFRYGVWCVSRFTGLFAPSSEKSGMLGRRGGCSPTREGRRVSVEPETG